MSQPHYNFAGRHVIQAVTLSESGVIPESTSEWGGMEAGPIEGGELIVTIDRRQMIRTLDKFLGAELEIIGSDDAGDDYAPYPLPGRSSKIENYILPFTAELPGTHFLVRGMSALDALVGIYCAEDRTKFMRYDFERAVEALGLDMETLSPEQRARLEKAHQAPNNDLAYVTIKEGPLQTLMYEPGALLMEFRGDLLNQQVRAAYRHVFGNGYGYQENMQLVTDSINAMLGAHLPKPLAYFDPMYSWDIVDALQSAYPGVANKMEAFLNDLRPQLPDDHPLKNYESPFFSLPSNQNKSKVIGFLDANIPGIEGPESAGWGSGYLQYPIERGGEIISALANAEPPIINAEEAVHAYRLFGLTPPILAKATSATGPVQEADRKSAAHGR